MVLYLVRDLRLSPPPWTICREPVPRPTDGVEWKAATICLAASRFISLQFPLVLTLCGTLLPRAVTLSIPKGVPRVIKHLRYLHIAEQMPLGRTRGCTQIWITGRVERIRRHGVQVCCCEVAGGRCQGCCRSLSYHPPGRVMPDNELDTLAPCFDDIADIFNIVECTEVT